MPSDTAVLPQHAEQFREEGYAIVRGLFPEELMKQAKAESDRVYAAGMEHPQSYRHGNLYFDILPESFGGQRYVLQAHWFAWINSFFEAFRRHENYFNILQPILGDDIKQIAQQIHWKPPGAGLTGFRYHQDLRFRTQPLPEAEITRSYITVGLAIDPATKENGCLQVLPGSHKRGYLGLSDEGGALMKGWTAEAELEAKGVDPADLVYCELAPGDAVIWSLLTLHGSLPNRSDKDRAFSISHYAKAEHSPERGEWAFRGGQSIPLGETPQICKYEQLREKPGPFYVEDRWFAA